MNKDTQNQDKAIEKIHREEGLDDNENDYNVNKTLSDSNLRDAEEEKDSEEDVTPQNTENKKDK
ncbi:MAG TPA: hypothetical protein VIY08_14860 [Candidatus Nitrosocosmicus sp.]